jgi:hypothetical protein
MHEGNLNKMSAKQFSLSCVNAMLLTGENKQQVKTLDRCWKKSSETKKGLTVFSCKPLLLLARPKRFERSTDGFVDQKSFCKENPHFQHVDC